MAVQAPEAPAYTAPPDWSPQPAAPQQPVEQPQPKTAPAAPAKGFTAPSTDQPSDFGGKEFTTISGHAQPQFTAPGHDQEVTPESGPFVSNETAQPPTDDELNGLDTDTLTKRLTNYSDVDPARAAQILHDRLQKDAANTTPAQGAQMLANDLTNTLSKISINPVEWGKGLVGFKNTLGGAADTVMRSLGLQDTANSRQDLEQQKTLGTVTQEQYDRGNALLNQIDDIKAKRAMLGPGGGAGESAEHEQELADEQSNIARMFFQANPSFAKTQASKALATVLTGTEHSLQSIAALPQQISDFDPVKYFTGHSKMANWSPDDLKDWINTERLFNVQRLQHAQGQVDPWSHALARFSNKVLQASGLWDRNADINSPLQVDPEKVGQVSQLATLLESEAMGRILPVGEIASGFSQAGLKTAGLAIKAAPPVARFAEKAVSSKIGRFITSPIQLALFYPELAHGDIGAMAWDAAKEGLTYGGLRVIDKYGPLAAEMFERAADNNFKGGGFLAQGLSRGLRLGADAVTNSFPYALLNSGGDPGQFWNNLTTLSAFHAGLGAPKTALDTLSGGTGDWLFARDGKVKEVPPRAYGVDQGLDQENLANINNLDPHLKNIVSRTQQAAGDHTDVYLVSPQTMQDYQSRFGATAQQTPRGFWVPPEYTGTGRSASFIDVNHVNDALPHEAMGHPLYWLMDPAARDAVADAAIKENDPDQFIKDNYGQNVSYDSLPDHPTPGNPSALSKDLIRTEMAVESIGDYWNGGSIEQFYKDKPGLARALRYGTGTILDRLGIPSSTWESTTTMGINPAFAPSVLIDGYYRDLLNHRIIRQNVPTNSLGRWPQHGETVTPGGAPPGGQAPGGGPLPGGGAPPAGGPQPTGGGPQAPQQPPQGPAGGLATAKPAKVLSVTGGGPQPQLPAPSGPAPIDESVIKGLMKQGFTRAQAEAFAAKGTVSPVNVPRVQAPPPEPVHPADTEAHHAAIEEAIKQGTPAGEAQAAAEGKRPQTLRETGEEPGFLIAGKRRGPPTQAPIWSPLATVAGVGAARNLPPPAPSKEAEAPTEEAQAPTKEAETPTAAPRAELVRAPRAELVKAPAAPGPVPSVKTPAEAQKPATEAPRPEKGTSKTEAAPPSGVTRVPTEGFRLTAYGPAVPGDQPGGPTYDKNSYRGIGDHDNELVNHYSASLSPEARSSIFPGANPNHSTGKEFFYAGNTYRDDDTAAQYFRGRNQGKVIDIFHSGGAMPSGGGGGGGGGGGYAPMIGGGVGGEAGTPFTFPAQVQTKFGAEVPAMNIEPEPFVGGGGESGGGGAGGRIEVAQPSVRAPSAEPEHVSPAMQQAQFEAYGGAYPGMVPSAPGFMPSFMPRKRMGGFRMEGEEGEPEEESTLGEPNPKGFEKLLPLLRQGPSGFKAAQKLHASLLSKDDARVQKGADNLFKGEHFVQGDPVHTAALANVPTNERMALAAGQTAIANKTPMHMTYASAPPDIAKESPVTRKSREINYDESSPQARLLGQTNARLAGHSIIPTAIGISTGRTKGAPNNGYVQGISTSVAAHNHHQLNQALAEIGQQSPYPELNSRKFRNDLSGYIQNLLAGHRGAGNAYQPGTEKYPANPDKDYVPYRLKQREADFLNAVINNQAARHSKDIRELAQKGGTLLTEEGETNPIRHAIDVSHAGMRPAAGEEIKDEGIKHAAEERWSKGMLEPTIRTFNAGLIHALHERHEDIPQEIRPTVPGYQELTKTLGRELGGERGRPDIAMAAGFMPAKKRPAPLSPEEHAELTSNIRKQFLSGKLRQADYMERLADVPEPGQEIGPAYMPMAGPKAQKFAQAEKEGRTFETPLPGGGKRFEIDDRDMEFKPASSAAQANQYLTSTGRPPKNALEERYLTDKRGPGRMPLSDAIRHPELFENYPFLRNTKISMDPTIRHYGHYEQPWLDEDGNPRGNHIVLQDPTDKETLAHEIQHAVQHYENYAGKGANSAEIAGKMRNDGPLREELRKQFDEAFPDGSRENERANWTKQRISKMAQAMYESEPGEIEARVAGARAKRLQPEEYEAGRQRLGLGHYIETTPKQDILDEMGHTAKNLRAAAIPQGFGYEPGIAYMPGGKGEFNESKPEDFIAARNKSKRPQFLSPLEPGDIQQHKLYMNDEHTAGAAVSPEGDIQNVFNNGGGKGAGQRALAHAIRNGGTHLDAYDPYLPGLYRQFGFKETGRMKFNRDYAPPNWNFEEDDDPDIVFMAHQGYPEGHEQAAIDRASGPKENWLPNERSTQQETDWDQAKNRSRAQVSGGIREVSRPEALGAGEKPRDQAGGADRGPVGPPEAPAFMVGGKAKKAAAAPYQPSKKTAKELGPRPEDEEQGKAWDKFAARMDKQIPGAIPLRPARNKKGQLKIDGLGNPEFEKESGGYHLANAPMLGKRALGYDAKGGVNKAPEGTVDTVAPGDLEYLSPADRLRISHLDKNGAIDMYADALNKEYSRVEKEIPAALKAKDWYNDTEGFLKKHFGEHADLVANLLAATSARTGVKTNYGFAMNAYHRFARGDYDRHIQLYLKALEMRRAEALAEHVAGLGYSPTSEAHAMALYIKHHDILPTQHDINDPTKKGAQYGMHSEKVLKVLAQTWLDELEGPKTRRYTGNMTGRSIQSTGDMWVGRQLRRLGFEGHTKKPWLVQAPAESGLSNLDFAIQELAHRRAAEKRGLEPRQHQAILWTSEIQHWLNNGWATGGDPAERDYRPMLEQYERPEWAQRKAA